MDIFPMTALYSIFKPGLLSWPKMQDGTPTLRLDQLSDANNLLHTGGRSHEAMADVECTLNLAVLLSGEEQVFRYVASFFDRQADRMRIEAMDKEFEAGGAQYRLGILVSPLMGSASGYLSQAVCLGRSRVYANQHLWLRLDRERLEGFAENVEESGSCVVRKRYGDVPFILPRLNRFSERLPDEGRRLADANLHLLQKDPKLLEKLAEYHVGFAYPYIPDLDADAALYQEGFFTSREKEEILSFHRAGPEEKRAMADKMTSRRLKTIAKRIVARNLLSAGSSSSDSSEPKPDFWEAKMPLNETIKGFRDDVKRTLHDARVELEQYRNSDLDAQQSRIADRLKRYLDSAIRTK